MDLGWGGPKCGSVGSEGKKVAWHLLFKGQTYPMVREGCLPSLSQQAHLPLELGSLSRRITRGLCVILPPCLLPSASSPSPSLSPATLSRGHPA